MTKSHASDAPKASVLQLVRTKDGQVSYVGSLPATMTFSTRWIESGGNGAVGDHKELHAQADELHAAGDADAASELRARAASMNLAPMFTRDGADIIFDFPDGPVRYRFFGFEAHPDGSPKYTGMRYEKVE